MSVDRSLNSWLQEQMGESRGSRRSKLQLLAQQVEAAKDPASYPAGSLQQTLAKSRKRQIVHKAMSLGYEPPEQQVQELGLRLVEQGLGLGL